MQGVTRLRFAYGGLDQSCDQAFSAHHAHPRRFKFTGPRFLAQIPFAQRSAGFARRAQEKPTTSYLMTSNPNVPGVDKR